MAAYTIVLTARPSDGPQVAEVLQRIVADSRALSWGAARWLADDEAVEIDIDTGQEPVSALLPRWRTVAHGARVDINAVPMAGRRKRLLVADMDSTIIQQECIDEMADVLGLKERIAAITERAMRGEMDFAAALRERLGLLAGLEEAALDSVFRERITLMDGARALVGTMRSLGAHTALVSGGFTFFTSRVRARVGFNVDIANQLVFEGGKLTGDVREPILGKEEKRSTLERLRREHGLAPYETMAVGDGANDLDMIRSAGIGVAYRAKPVVAAQAAAAIMFGDLRSLLYLQGIAKDEHIETI